MNPKASLIIGIFCIAFSPIFVKLADVPPITSGFYRLFIAWLCLAPYCIAKGMLKIAPKDLVIAIIGGLVFGADIAVWNLSLIKISATVSTLIANLAPLWVGLLSYILFKKTSGKLFWIGTFVAITGMVVLVGYQHILHLEFNVGILLALLASFFYAVYMIITKGILQRVTTVTFMFYNMLAASIFMMVISIFQGHNMYSFTAKAWFCFLATGLLCQLAGWLTINYALKHLDPAKVSIALLSQTVLACFLATIFLKETLELNEVIGSAIVLAGIAVTFLRPKKAVAHGL